MPAKIIFLNRHGGELIGGTDAAADGVSSVVLSGKKDKVLVPKWNGGKRRWARVVACVRDQFKPFDVVVTDERPSGRDFLMAMVGGRAKDIGIHTKHVGGLAPFAGRVIPRAIVFAFSRQLGNRVRAVCEALAMEIGHAYGLDHVYYCPDVMTYLRGCGRKRFRDKSAPCGESKKRDVETEAPAKIRCVGCLRFSGLALRTDPLTDAEVEAHGSLPLLFFCRNSRYWL